MSIKDPEHDPNWLRSLVQEMREDGFTDTELADILQVPYQEVLKIGDGRQRDDSEV